jgi:multidrug resistance protein
LKKYSYSQELFFVLILAIVQFSHILDFVVIMPLGPTLMKDFSISPAAFAALVSSYNFSAAFSNILFGLIADSYDRKRLLLIFIIGFSIGTFWCFISESYYSLLASRIVAGAFGGVLSSIVFTIVTDIVPEERRGRAMGIVMSSFSVSSIIGIPIGLIISDNYGWQYCFLFIFMIAIICFVLSAFYMPKLTDHLDNEVSKQNFLESLKTTVSNSIYLRSLVFMFLTSGSLFLLIPFLSPFAVKNMGIETFELKYMYLYGGLLTIGTARIFGVLTDKIGAFKLYIIVLCLAFVPILLFTHSGPTTFVKYIIMGALFMSFVSGRMIPCMTLLSTVPLLKDRGVFMSLLNSVRALGSASMTFLAGFIIMESSTGELVGFNYAGYLSILIGFVTIGLGVYINREIQNRAHN